MKSGFDLHTYKYYAGAPQLHLLSKGKLFRKTTKHCDLGYLKNMVVLP